MSGEVNADVRDEQLQRLQALSEQRLLRQWQQVGRPSAFPEAVRRMLRMLRIANGHVEEHAAGMEEHEPLMNRSDHPDTHSRSRRTCTKKKKNKSVPETIGWHEWSLPTFNSFVEACVVELGEGWSQLKKDEQSVDGASNKENKRVIVDRVIDSEIMSWFFVSDDCKWQTGGGFVLADTGATDAVAAAAALAAAALAAALAALATVYISVGSAGAELIPNTGGGDCGWLALIQGFQLQGITITDSVRELREQFVQFVNNHYEHCYSIYYPCVENPSQELFQHELTSTLSQGYWTDTWHVAIITYMFERPLQLTNLRTYPHKPHLLFLEHRCTTLDIYRIIGSKPWFVHAPIFLYNHDMLTPLQLRKDRGNHWDAR
jgi:hypothetical protein